MHDDEIIVLNVVHAQSCIVHAVTVYILHFNRVTYSL